MTAIRESIYLPVLFLTEAVLGGFRPGAPLVLAPPSLFALVLAVLLGVVLVRSGALDPLRVMHASREPLANMNGFTVLATLWLSSAQMFSLLTPDAGLPKILLSVYFLVQMLTTMAASPDRVRVLRSLAVIFGAAFVLKFVVLDAVSDPAGGRLTRLLQVLFEGVTFGTLTQDVHHPAAGYLAFATIGLFLIGVSLLPASGGAQRTSRTLVLREG